MVGQIAGKISHDFNNILGVIMGHSELAFMNCMEYDLISLDYILPGNITGMDIYRHIRKTNQTLPILFISGNIEFLESVKELKSNDARVDHLSKPCRNQEYIERINCLLEQAGQS